MQTEIYLKQVLRSCYCKVVFIVLFLLFYFILPIRTLNSFAYFLGLIFVFLFALSLTCMIRNIKEKIKLNKSSKSSWINLIASAVGLSALQVCGLGGPVCGASLGLSFLSAVLPNFVLHFLIEYSYIILLIAIFFQILSLYFLKCFVKVKSLINPISDCSRE